MSNDEDIGYPVPLTGKHGRGKYAIVSACDVDRVLAFKWSVQNGYPVAGTLRFLGRFQPIRLHNFIMNNPPTFRSPDGLVVDHINRNRLDARRSNLRLLTFADNARNGSKRRTREESGTNFIGVTFHRHTGKWQPTLTYKGEIIRFKQCNTDVEAARARDAMIRKMGIVAHLNFPDDDMGMGPTTVDPSVIEAPLFFAKTQP